MKNTLSLAVLLLLPAAAEANSFILDKSQVKVDMPRSWRVEDSGENVTFSTMDKRVAISLTWAGPSLDRAWEVLTKEVDKMVSGMKVERKSGQTGSFTGYVATGNGLLGKAKVHCYLSAVMTPGGAMTVFMMHGIGKEEPHKAHIKQFFDGLAPLQGASK